MTITGRSEETSKPQQDRTVTTEEKNHRRSERVVLRIPVGLSAITPDGKRMHIEAHTLVVNAHGGLLDTGIELLPGQRILLHNPKTEDVESCRVVRVESSEGGRFAVAFEFQCPSPTFWPVSFPPSDWYATVSGR
jgi:hypothetical protein